MRAGRTLLDKRFQLGNKFKLLVKLLIFTVQSWEYPSLTDPGGVKMNKVLGYATHAFTASGTLFGLAALYLIDKGSYQWAFGAMLLTILIDAVDGTIARRIHIKELIRHIDGATLDNIVDFFTYSMVPCYF